MTARPWTLTSVDERPAAPLGMYVHVPFCERRCGYCAFNTYSLGEASGSSIGDFVLGALAEIELAARALSGGLTTRQPLESVYFGGGTPTTLEAAQIEQILDGVRTQFELSDAAEVTVESNPDGIDGDYLEALLRAGVNRISFGMQSTSRRVLNLLDRTHDPVRALSAVEEARAAGFDHVSLDLIYGTPGEDSADFQRSLEAAIASGVDHVSAYALAIEPGTKLAARVRSGVLPRPSDDEAASRYKTADAILSEAGFSWYEISNWSLTESARSRHNVLYWTNSNWWGIGPGAHSHLNGVRWWNLNLPDAWSAPLLGNGLSAAGSHVGGYEVLTAEQRRLEHVMLGIRLASGLTIDGQLSNEVIAELVSDGLVTVSDTNRLVLTLRGRLLTDHVVDRLT